MNEKNITLFFKIIKINGIKKNSEEEEEDHLITITLDKQSKEFVKNLFF
jgi:hypothetical protein